jgi:hypothetical protein
MCDKLIDSSHKLQVHKHIVGGGGTQRDVKGPENGQRQNFVWPTGSISAVIYSVFFSGQPANPLLHGKHNGGIDSISSVRTRRIYIVRSARKLRARRTEYKSVFFHTT